MDPVTSIVFSLFVVLMSVVIHEYAHGAVAYQLGDPTAKNMGRLTLNPIKHLDPLGSIIVPALLLLTTGRAFGWAKPVPVNPYNFRDQRWGELKVAIAGPLSNIALALAFGLLLRFAIPVASPLFELFSIIVIINLLLAIFNLIPVPPLDGSHILFSLLPARFQHFKQQLQQYGMFIVLFVVFFGIQFVFGLVVLAYTLIVGQFPVF